MSRTTLGLTVFTGAELNMLNAACTATHKRVRTTRPRRRRFGF